MDDSNDVAASEDTEALQSRLNLMSDLRSNVQPSDNDTEIKNTDQLVKSV